MTTKTKNNIKEIHKIELFNILYDTDFQARKENEYHEWYGKTLKEYLEESNWKAPEKKPEIYGLVRRVSPNGMNRQISFFIVKWNRIINITYYMSYILDGKEPKRDSYNNDVISVHGTGMDMVFHTIYSLGNVMFRDIILDIDNSGYMFTRAYM